MKYNYYIKFKCYYYSLILLKILNESIIPAITSEVNSFLFKNWRPDEIFTIYEGIEEVGIEEVGIEEVGIVDVGIEEVGIEEVGI